MGKIKYKLFTVLPDFGTNTYLVWEEASREAMLVDIAYPDRSIIDYIVKKDIILKYLVNTHGHGDHIAGNRMIIEEYDVPLMIHVHDAEMLSEPDKNLSTYWNQRVTSPGADIILRGGEEFFLGRTGFEIIHTPGHTRGGICVRIGDLLISGDTIFAGSIGRTDLPGGDTEQLLNMIKTRLFVLPEQTVILPGHGPESSIGQEIIDNPFVGLAARF